MGVPHKHAEIIKAWADGADIEKQNRDGTWVDMHRSWPWYEDWAYRIKPQPKPDRIEVQDVYINLMYKHYPNGTVERHVMNNHYVKLSTMELTFDGETNALKKAEVL